MMFRPLSGQWLAPENFDEFRLSNSSEETEVWRQSFLAGSGYRIRTNERRRSLWVCERLVMNIYDVCAVSDLDMTFGQLVQGLEVIDEMCVRRAGAAEGSREIRSNSPRVSESSSQKTAARVRTGDRKVQGVGTGPDIS